MFKQKFTLLYFIVSQSVFIFHFNIADGNFTFQSPR